MKETMLRGTIAELDREVQNALDETEPHDYYERLVRIEALVKELSPMAQDIMILSMTAYNSGFSDAMSGDPYNSPYTTKDERSADYALGFQIGINEYES
jgi:hypothetical protein|tara:strand:- start:731 stop:1027 length:297 start_codon:yes stop_codon:yes gene_type:complete